MYDEQGEKTWDCTLDVYGKVANFEGSSLKECPFRWAGQYFDSETNLCYNRFRYYSPETGSYLSQDPIRLAGNNPTLYAYVPDPNTWLDPFGLDCDKSKVWQDKDGRWRNPNGTFAKNPGWPDNFGFAKGKDNMRTLGTGHRVDRYGGTNGEFVADAGTPFTQRSLPASTASKEYHTYEVTKPIDGVRTGTAEPWFGQQGGGVQHQLPNSVQYHLDNGSLKEI